MTRYALALLLFAAPMAASSVSFGSSWDGAPPGTFADLVGDRARFIVTGMPDFPPGYYRITVDGGYSMLESQDVVGFEGPTTCSPLVNCTLGHAYVNPITHTTQATVLEVYQDQPWHLTGWSPNVGPVRQSGQQFVFVETAPGSWRWGFEDLNMGGDRDYNDIFGSITRVR